MEGNWISEVAKGCIEARSENEWVKDLPDTPHSFGGLRTFTIAAHDVERAGQTIPGSPILRKLD